MGRFKNEIRIVLVGKTGTGKSSTGNTILNRTKFKAELNVLAVTGKSSFGTRKMRRNKLVVVDTPGILDTHRDKEEIKKEIIKSIGISVPGPHAVLYVMRIGDRLTDDERHCIKIFTDMFGEDIFQFVIVVFTKGNDLHGLPLSKYVKNAPAEFQDLFRKCDNRMLALDNEGTSLHKSQKVDRLIGMIEKMMHEKPCYSNAMLESAKVAFIRRMDEIGARGEEDDVRTEIEEGGTAFKYLLLAAGLGSLVGSLLTGTAIVGPAVAVAKVGGFFFHVFDFIA